jgi:hypothetical protein
MAKDWCVCNIGTGHSSSEPDNLLVRVFHALPPGTGKINDGPGHQSGDLMGNVFGHGLKDRLRKTMEAVPDDAQRVFLVGHSRGAILSYLIANALKRDHPAKEVHIFNVDPVARYASGTDDKALVQENVRSVTAVVMENDNAKKLFKLTFVDATSPLPIEYVPMPGTHGTATQVNFANPVGMATLQMILRWLNEHKVPLATHPQPLRGINEIFFAIHQANPVKGFTATGAVKSRGVTDWDKSKPKPKEQAAGTRRAMLATAGISNPHTAGGGDRFANPGLFVNTYHADLFKSAYPASYHLVTKRPDQLPGGPMTPGDRGQLAAEISDLRARNFTWKTLTALGMAHRLERLSANPLTLNA